MSLWLLAAASATGLLTADQAARAEAKAIGLDNKAKIFAYTSTKHSIALARMANEAKATNVANEVLQASAIEQRNLQTAVLLAESAGVMKRGQGITTGNSAARELEVMYTKTSQAMLDATQEKQSMITKLNLQLETAQTDLAQRERDAWNKTKAGLVTGSLANLRVQSAALQGFSSGFGFGANIGSLATR